MHRRRRLAGFAVVLSIATAVVGAAPPVPAAPGDRAAIQDLLDERADALLRGDRKAFLATLAPDSAAFVRRQKALFRNVQSLPLGSFRSVAEWDRLGDLVRDGDRDRYDDVTEAAIPVTEERYRIRGYDRGEAVEDVFFTFIKRDGRWLIAEDTDLDDLTLQSGRTLWHFGPLALARGEHFLQLSHPCSTATCPAESHDYLGLAERALDRAVSYWPAPWDRRVILLVPDDQAELRRMIQATFDLEAFVAFAYSSTDESEGIEYSGHRIILNPPGFSGRADETVVTILAHELIHIATRNASGPFVPYFLDEGIAEYGGYAGGSIDVSDAASRASGGGVPNDYEFLVGNPLEIYRSYQRSHSAVAFFVERWGLRAFARFYQSLGSVKVASGTARYHMDRALKKTIGLDLTGFEREWADSIR